MPTLSRMPSTRERQCQQGDERHPLPRLLPGAGQACHRARENRQAGGASVRRNGCCSQGASSDRETLVRRNKAGALGKESPCSEKDK